MKTIIEINGHKYDARTGALLKDEPKSAIITPAAKESTPTRLPNKGQVIDGINRRPGNHQHQPAKVATQSVKPVSNRTAVKAAPNVHAHHISTPLRSTFRSVEKSKTLFRTAVKKPLAKPDIHSASAPIVNSATIDQAADPKQLSTPALRRANYAKRIAQSPNISHFGTFSRNNLARVVSSLGVTSAPKASETALPPPIVGRDGSTSGKPQVFNHRVTKVNYQTSSRSPSEKLAKRLSRRLKVKPKVAAVVASILVVLVSGSFFAYQKIPSVAMRVAARTAGFSGRLPSNIPAGYSFKGPIESSKDSGGKGIITLHYQSNSDERQFSIVQEPTSWTSESLLMNYVESKDAQPKKSVGNGLTIYIYNGENATWVDKGVWFKINGEGSLSSDQILAIAGSF